MADGGIASGALLGAVLSSAQNKDPLQGALMGGLGSLAFGAFGADAVGVDQSLGAVGADQSLGAVGTQNAFANSLGSQTTIPIQDTGTGLFGNASAIAGNPQLGGVASPVSNLAGTNLQDYGAISPYAAGSTNGIVGAQGPLTVAEPSPWNNLQYTSGGNLGNLGQSAASLGAYDTEIGRAHV